MEEIEKLSSNYTDELRKLNLREFENEIELCEEKPHAQQAIEEGKIVCTGFCSLGMDGYDCAEVVEKDIGGFIRGKRVDEETHEFPACIICGKPATCTIYIAKSY